MSTSKMVVVKEWLKKGMGADVNYLNDIYIFSWHEYDYNMINYEYFLNTIWYDYTMNRYR